MAEQMTVLHVDDDQELLSVSGELFSRWDDRIETVTAESAARGLERFESTSVDCVVSDNVLLPDGTPLVVAVRERNPEIPIVLFTGSGWTDVAEVIKAGDVTEYVRKAGAEDFELVAQHVVDLVRDAAQGTAGERPEEILTLEGGWEIVDVHDWDDELELGTRIVEAVEAYHDRDAMGFEPLFDSIDPEALEQLLAPEGRAIHGERAQVRFSWVDLEIVVTNTGSIAVRPVDALDPSSN